MHLNPHAHSEKLGVNLKKIKLTHGYHDALIKEIQYRDESDVTLNVDVCSCCNPSPGRYALCFYGVRNFATVQEAIESSRVTNVNKGYIDEIIGIARDDERGFLLDLATAGSVRIDAKGLHES